MSAIRSMVLYPDRYTEFQRADATQQLVHNLCATASNAGHLLWACMGSGSTSIYTIQSKTLTRKVCYGTVQPSHALLPSSAKDAGLHLAAVSACHTVSVQLISASHATVVDFFPVQCAYNLSYRPFQLIMGKCLPWSVLVATSIATFSSVEVQTSRYNMVQLAAPKGLYLVSQS